MTENRKKRWVMVIDSRKCFDCKACDVACKRENGIEAKGNRDVYRNWITSRGIEGTFPNLKQRFEPSQCQQCANPPCVRVCPTRASHLDQDGLVQIDGRRCIVCGACILSCPYDARFKSPQTKVIDKCTFCNHRIAVGKQPACVDTCPTKVRVFGDLNDPESEVSRLLARHHYFVLKPKSGTQPSLFYLS